MQLIQVQLHVWVGYVALVGAVGWAAGWWLDKLVAGLVVFRQPLLNLLWWQFTQEPFCCWGQQQLLQLKSSRLLLHLSLSSIEVIKQAYNCCSPCLLSHACNRPPPPWWQLPPRS
ncbi:hypothetical protein V8C86DRAFT_2647894 [Haematococcus lacustris]